MSQITRIEWKVGDAHTGDVRLRYMEAGSGRLVMMLHGFPDSPHTWRFQRDAIVRAGFRVVAPWLPGYGDSGKPRRVRDYRVEALAHHLAALVPALGETKAAAIIGHDWGGVIAWRLAAERTALAERLIVLNAPHPAALARKLWRPDQLARSMYAMFLQLPWLPERVLGARDLAMVRRAIERMVRRKESFGESDWRAIHGTLATPGALRAALAYYRAAGRRMLRRRSAVAGRIRRVEVPTLVLWGEQDEALSPRLSRGLERWVSDLLVRRFSEAGHWVHWDEPEAVRTEMLSFLASDGTTHVTRA